MVEKGSNSVLISGWNNKRSMTATFTNTFHRKSFPMQLIYGGNTNQSLPKFEFPIRFFLSANPKHYSNTAESIKLTKEIIIPHIGRERILLKLPKTQPELLIMDVLRR